LFAIILAATTSTSVRVAQADDETIKAKRDPPTKPAGLPLIQRPEQKESTPPWLKRNSVSEYLQRRALLEQDKSFRQAQHQQPRLPPDIIERQKIDPTKQSKWQFHVARKAVDDFIQRKV
jgi:hypothetical protein